MKWLLKTVAFVLFGGILIHVSCKKEYSCENCPHTNQPPIADAGPDQKIILPKDSTSLDGSGSKNPDGIIVKYQWTKLSGPASFTFTNVSVVKATVKNLLTGIYEVELKVTDNGGLSAKDTMRIIVDSLRMIDSLQIHGQVPIANVNADTIIVLPNDSAFLNGDISYDPDGQIVSYQWIKLSGPSSYIISNPLSVRSKVHHLVKGVYQFELKVTDNDGLSAKDTIQIRVEVASAINQRPVANAGPDISINYNLQTCSITSSLIPISGSASFDPDGTIIDYSWSQVPGPPQATIANGNSMNTSVANLLPDTYYFVLTVTDNNHATDEDTVAIKVASMMNRPIVPAQLIPVGTLSQSRENIAIASAGNKILFAGGFLSSAGAPEKSRVDIYDIPSNTWTNAELSQARYNIGVAVHQNHIYFGGGNHSDQAFREIPSDRIDIYNATTNSWSIDSLKVARPPIGASVNDKIIFAGGGPFDANSDSRTADIYNVSVNAWSGWTLSSGRKIFSATTIGSKAFFAGGIYGFDGVTRDIDIYDASSGSWSLSSFSAPFNQGWAPDGTAVGNKNYWAGGYYYSQASYVSPTNHVEIRDENTHSSTFGCLFQANTGFDVVSKDNKIVFFTGTGVEKNKFDIYDITGNTWSIGELSQNIQGASIISVNNTIYVAGGYINGVLSNKVWKLNF